MPNRYKCLTGGVVRGWTHEAWGRGFECCRPQGVRKVAWLVLKNELNVSLGGGVSPSIKKIAIFSSFSSCF